MIKLIKSFLLVALVTALVAPASARLVVAAEGTLIAGATNTTFTTVNKSLDTPVYYNSVVFYNSGTNVITATLSKADGSELVTLGTAAITINDGTNLPPYSADAVITNAYPLSSIRLAATKTAGGTNGTESVLFYRVYGDTER